MMSQTDGFQEENDHEECSGGTEESNSDALNDDEFNPTEVASIDSTTGTELLSMPTEILKHIFMHLEDKDLLSTSHVCKLFAVIVEIIFAQKYSNQVYEVYNCALRFHAVMLSKYGAKMSTICIRDVPNKVLSLVEQKCSNLTAVELNYVPRILNLGGLKEIRLNSVDSINKTRFCNLIVANPRLEKLTLNGCNQLTHWMEVLHDRLPLLNDLVWIKSYHSGTINIPRITLPSLESLFIDKMYDLIRVLRVIDCENLKEIKLSESTEAIDDLITQIGKFQTLSTLKLTGCSLTMTQIEKLTTHLPQLTEFAVKLTKSETSEDAKGKIFGVLYMFPKLRKFHVTLQDHENVFQSQSINQIHIHFTTLFPNAEVKISKGDKELLCTSRDRIYVCDHDSMELHWMENFNEKTIRNTIANANPVYILRRLKFINNCAVNLDISILSGQNSYDIKCLEIYSKGALSANTTDSFRSAFFPHLKKLKIYLENHTAIDFLRCIEPKFCTKVSELWINTKTVEQHEMMNYNNEMIRILRKFRNLKTLHSNEPIGILAL